MSGAGWPDSVGQLAGQRVGNLLTTLTDEASGMASRCADASTAAAARNAGWASSGALDDCARQWENKINSLVRWMNQERGVRLAGYRTLVGIVCAGLVLGLVLPILGVWQEMTATQGNECVPYFNQHHLAPLPLSVLILGRLGLICAIAGAASAYQLDSGMRRLAEQLSRPTTGLWKVVLAGSGVVVIVAGISVVLIYQPFFFRVPVCAMSMPVGL